MKMKNLQSHQLRNLFLKMGAQMIQIVQIILHAEIGFVLTLVH